MVKAQKITTNTIFGFGVKGSPSSINDRLQFNNALQQFEWTPDEGRTHAQISDSTSQQPIVTTPIEISMDTDDDLSGITHPTPQDIIVPETGTYFILAAPQTVRTSGAMPRFIDFWLRINDVDVVNSNVRVSLDKNSDTDVILTQYNLDLTALDKINIMMSISATGEGLGIAAINPAGEPRIPSIIVTLIKIN